MSEPFDQIVGVRHRELLMGDLRSLLEWLDTNANPEDPARWRYAPSLICRGDAEILAISSPRFASRFIFENNSTSFINFRRKAELLKTLLGRQPTRRSADHLWRNLDYDEESPVTEEFLRRKVHQCSHIADCVLEIPSRLERNYTFVKPTENLGASYGENGSPTALPYVEMLDLSGACTQSVLFLVSMILKSHVNGVHGIAEISSQCRAIDCDEFLIDDVFENQISDHCEKIGLRYFKQASLKTDPHVDVEKFASLLTAYVKSSFPISVPVDLARMFGIEDTELPDCSDTPLENTYRKIPGYESAPDFLKSGSSENHQILIIGVSNTPNLSERKFVFHDSAVRPYITIDVNQLYKKGCILRDVDTNEKNLASGHFSAFLPRRVTLPLAGFRTTSDEGRGLIDYLEEFFDYCERYQLGLPGVAKVYECEFRLVRLESVIQEIAKISLDNSFQLISSGIDKIVADLKVCSNDKGIGSVFCWLQVSSTAVWIWKAQVDDDFSPKSISDFLDSCCLYYFGEGNGKILSTEFSIPGGFDFDRDQNFSGRIAGTGIKEFSIATSIAVSGLRENLSLLPSDCRAFELYAFMESDLQTGSPLMEGISLNFESRQVVKVLPQIRNIPNGIAILAKNINSLSDGRLITSIATYFPEITSPCPEMRRSAIESLKAVQDLACELSVLQAATIKAIEIVAGSRISSLWVARKRGDESSGEFVMATLEDWESQKETLFDSLRQIIQGSQSTIPFAIEVEPGTLFFLNGRFQLRTLCDSLSADVELRSRVGVNLDLPHWALARINLSEVSREIRNRIVHIHISDHDKKGHFGDVLFSEMSNATKALDVSIVTFLATLVTEAPLRDLKTTVPFSSVATLEYEAGYLDPVRISEAWRKLCGIK